MQTSAKAQRITTAAHSYYPVLPLSENQIVVKDTRLRDWHLASDGGLGTAAVVRAGLNASGEIVRIRTLEGSPYLYTGTLDIQYATPADSLTWSGNTITEDALYGAGVDLWIDDVDADQIDAFWVDADAVTIKTAHSADGGHTWGAASTVATVSGQGADVLLQLCAPDADTLIFTDSTVGQDESGNNLTALYVTLKVTGSWITPVLWDLGGQALGVEQRVTLPNNAVYPSNLSGVVVSNGSVGIALYSTSFRESFEDGIWLQRVANLDYGSTTQHLHWNKTQEIFQTVAVDDDNNATEIFEAFPRIQMVGTEYWIITLESSQQAGHQRYHLGFHRSTDGLVWSDRNFRQGAAYDVNDVSEDTSGAYAYDFDQPFLYTDLIYANLIVTAERTFIIGYDRSFWCNSTDLVGVSNPLMEMDITDIVYSWDVNLPTAPSAGQASYNLGMVPKDYDGNDILTAHRGVVIDQEAGYHTANGDELIPVGRFHVDNIQHSTELGSQNGVVMGLDNTMLLDRYKSPIFWEYFGPQQLAFGGFCDLIPFNTIFGSFYTSVAGNLKSGVVKQSDNFRENVAVLNMEQADGGFLVTRFRCERDWTDNRMGVAFEGRGQGDGDDNKRFWAVLYNKVSGCFSLHQAIPRTNANRVKLYKYRSALYTSGPVTLNDSQAYWIRVGLWHGHVMAWYTTDTAGEPDAGSWVKVIDYTSPASPVNSVMPCRIGWWALMGTYRTSPSGPIGQLSSLGGMQDLSDGLGNPMVVALHVQLGSGPSILRRVNVALTQENTGADPMPDARIMLVAGTATSPGDLTDDDNIIFSRDASSLYFGVHDSPRWMGANDKPNPRRVKLDSLEHVWVCVTFNGTLAAGQSYKWASDTTGTYGTNQTKYSTNDGATWNNFGDANLNLCACIEVEYMGGLVKFSRLYFGSGEPTYTIEELAHQIAAKAEVLDITPDDFLAQADLTLGPDSIYWQPTSYGKVSTIVLDTDVALSGSPYSRTGRVIVGSSTIDVGDGDGYIIELDTDNQTIAYYTPGNVLSLKTESLQWIPESFHLRVVNQNSFLYVYINECLASNWYMDGVETPGYVGLDSVGADWTNVRIPDLTQIVEYFNIQAKESSMSALQRLVAKPAPGTISRGKFFIRYDGSLRISSFARQVVVDTYENTILSTSKTETQRPNVSHIRDSGNYYADRFHQDLLDSDGVIFDERDYTDARSDVDAYDAAILEFRNAVEQQTIPTFRHTAVFAAEREDKIQIISPTDRTVAEALINGLSFHFDADSSESIEDVQPRLAAGF